MSAGTRLIRGAKVEARDGEAAVTQKHRVLILAVVNRAHASVSDRSICFLSRPALLCGLLYRVPPRLELRQPTVSPQKLRHRQHRERHIVACETPVGGSEPLIV